MSEFSSLLSKINDLSKSQQKIHISGIDANLWLFIFNHYLKENINFHNSNIYVCKNEDEAEKHYSLLKENEQNTFYFPDLSQNPFSTIIQSELNLIQRIKTLYAIKNTSKRFNLVTTYRALFLKLPSPNYLSQSFLKLEISDIIVPTTLSQTLIKLGYSHTPTVEEPGTFTQKGEIFDIYPINHNPIRIHYFDDMIEEIYNIDKDTLKTIKDSPLKTIELNPLPKGLLGQDEILQFRSRLPRPLLSDKNKTKFREDILSKLSGGHLFDNYPLYFSLFFEDTVSLIDYIPKNSHFHIFSYEENVNTLEFNFEEMTDSIDQIKNDQNFDEIYPDFDDIFYKNIDLFQFFKFYIDEIDIQHHTTDNLNQNIQLNIESTEVFLKKNSKSIPSDRFNFIKTLFAEIKNILINNNQLIILYRNQKSLEEIKYLLETNKIHPQHSDKISFSQYNLSHGFYYINENTFYLSESDLFSQKIKKTKTVKKRRSDLFADQLSTLSDGDYVIHKQHGVGKYLGIEKLNHGKHDDDFLVIEYADGDKVYVPVYKLNLIQKHTDSKTHTHIDNLKTKKFDSVKKRAKKSVKKLAFDLLELQAKRKLKKGYSFSEPDHIFKEFELSFPFEETPDQINAIDDVLYDMQKQTPMDRLVCGDVGFGKTEVAMRAAFKAVLDNKQVALLVPTTVLAYQHYNTFKKRFSDFAVNIEFISRFKTTKQANEILDRLNKGQIDILIGTHKLLSDKVKFNDIGLLIIDEEQRFGVAHKEKLKLLRENLDTLVLTATPIPRTLQMSFLGIKELSLIQTPPPKRQSIKTYIIKDNSLTIKNAIEKELKRGGQVFIVHNRVHDINDYAAKLKKLVPSAKFVVAHGQLKEKDLERYIKDFYEHKYDILVSTTIIESGIDIPAANTMIIDRADTYGLSQLHQLRGRIGRSDKKAYAYFIIPTNKNLSDIANKRLQALQTYADMGSGFSLATSDLEIRGSGDILGPEQSGHIANIGLELYMELLQEAVNELKGKENQINQDIEIQTPFKTSIPNKYVNNPGLRLKYYKKMANCKNYDELEQIYNELCDQYGLAPETVSNLVTILKSRINFNHLALNSVKVQSKAIHLNFDKKQLDENEQLRNKIINLFMQRPKIYKIKPNYSVICSFKESITPETLFDFSKYIAEQIDPC